MVISQYDCINRCLFDTVTLLHGYEKDKMYIIVLTFSHFMSGFSCVLIEKNIMCASV